ncbi:MAG: hypothetical protein V4692_07420 [Bdellovibrionota bacterium]
MTNSARSILFAIVLGITLNVQFAQAALANIDLSKIECSPGAERYLLDPATRHELKKDISYTNRLLRAIELGFNYSGDLLAVGYSKPLEGTRMGVVIAKAHPLDFTESNRAFIEHATGEKFEVFNAKYPHLVLTTLAEKHTGLPGPAIRARLDLKARKLITPAFVCNF